MQNPNYPVNPNAKAMIAEELKEGVGGRWE